MKEIIDDPIADDAGLRMLMGQGLSMDSFDRLILCEVD